MNKKKKAETKKLLAAALVSLLVLAAASSRGIQIVPDRLNDRRFTSQFAWWGSLYPRTCLKSAMCLVEETEGQESDRETDGQDSDRETDCWQEIEIPGQEDLPVKIRWKCMDLF